MKIILSTYEKPGLTGNFRRASQIALGLTKNNIECVLISSSRHLSLTPHIFTQDGYTVVESIGIFPSRIRQSGYDVFDLLFRSFFILTHNPSFIYGFNPKPVSLLSSYIAAKLAKKRLMYDWADLWGPGGISDGKKGLSKISGYLESFLETWAIKNSNVITCISESMVKKARKLGAKKIVYLPVGITQDLPPEGKDHSKKKLGIDKSYTLLGFIYTDSPDKTLLRKIIRQSKVILPNVLFIIIGPPLFKEKNKPNNVFFNNFLERNQIGTYLNACDICILPFSNKKINKYRNPNKIGDYLAAEKPFISNNFGEPAKLIKKFDVGWLTSARASPSTFLETITYVLSNPNTIKMKINNIKKNKSQLEWSNLVKPLVLSLKTK